MWTEATEGHEMRSYGVADHPGMISFIYSMQRSLLRREFVGNRRIFLENNTLPSRRDIQSGVRSSAKECRCSLNAWTASDNLKIYEQVDGISILIRVSQNLTKGMAAYQEIHHPITPCRQHPVHQTTRSSPSAASISRCSHRQNTVNGIKVATHRRKITNVSGQERPRVKTARGLGHGRVGSHGDWSLRSWISNGSLKLKYSQKKKEFLTCAGWRSTMASASE